MKFMAQLPTFMKGIICIVAGFILLFDTLGIATEILHTIVLLGAIGLILWGIYLSDIHMMIYRLLSKENPKDPPQ